MTRIDVVLRFSLILLCSVCLTNCIPRSTGIPNPKLNVTIRAQNDLKLSVGSDFFGVIEIQPREDLCDLCAPEVDAGIVLLTPSHKTVWMNMRGEDTLGNHAFSLTHVPADKLAICNMQKYKGLMKAPYPELAGTLPTSTSFCVPAKFLREVGRYEVVFRMNHQMGDALLWNIESNSLQIVVTK